MTETRETAFSQLIRTIAHECARRYHSHEYQSVHEQAMIEGRYYHAFMRAAVLDAVMSRPEVMALSHGSWMSVDGYINAYISLIAGLDVVLENH